MESMAESMDLISDLPDQLLHHILSFLDMIFVVRTSILSKRWRHLWKSLHILNFSEEVFDPLSVVPSSLDHDGDYNVTDRQEDHFMDFVNRVLVHLHRQGNLITTFSIMGIYSFPLMKTESFACVRRNGEESFNRRTLDLPNWFFSCKPLTTLKLDMGTLKGRPFFQIPNLDSVSLPCLRKLHLEFLYFVDGDNVTRFLSKCPVLESLVIVECLLKERTSLTISAPQLKKLEVALSRPEKLIGKDLIGENDKVIVLAPMLTSFRCGDELLREFCLDLQNVSSLVEADIDSRLPRVDKSVQVLETYCQNVIKCLKDVSHVESLTIYMRLLEDVHQAHPNFGCQINPFLNLRILKTRTIFGRELIVIITLLEACPHLERLELERVLGELDTEFRCLMFRREMIEHIAEGGDPIDMLVKLSVLEQEIWETKDPAQCLSYNLKFVEIRGACGTLGEFKFLKYLLKNAMVLVKIDLFVSEHDLSEYQRSVEIFSKLVAFAQRSSSVEICYPSEYN